ncbi:Carbonyl reductase [NADPH] 1 [Chionoecetes opilio]|uniref:Carbonyl reductase [NADPH] 1 n=1 Tax=Chionoecetes opilio TaxID=41210 RepID=A0A8J4YLH1_CHIOP|nr:Carbonyl reductase [NADPH] 1 [Chionoecetes opilio]
MGEQAENTIRINFTGTLAVCRALFPLLRPHARVCHVSSSAGHLSEITGDEPAAAQPRAKLAADTLTEEQPCGLMENFVTTAKEGRYRRAGWPGSTYVVSKVGVSALTRIQQHAFNSDPRCDLVVN